MNVKKKILILEPYFGGSHKQFLEGIGCHVEAEYRWLTLPARKWKMRMQLSAFWFVEQIKSIPQQKRHFDVVLCSTFVDVAVLKSQLMSVDGWNPESRIVTYFHENQFAYPNQMADQANHQFTAINFTTAVASDKLAFNSEYNRNTFLKGCEKYLKKAADMKLIPLMDKLKGKSSVLYPPIDFSAIDTPVQIDKNNVPIIVWNHRWEHDKDPETFFNALYLLKGKGIKFKVIVLGQAFRFQPHCFATAQVRLAEEIVHFGYVNSYQEYLSYLKQGDLVISTSLHEFYGISIIEAVRAGCLPVLPDRLSYPELFDKQFLYKDGELVETLEKLLKERVQLTREEGVEMTEKFSWAILQPEYEKWLFEK